MVQVRLLIKMASDAVDNFREKIFSFITNDVIKLTLYNLHKVSLPTQISLNNCNHRVIYASEFCN